MFAGVSRVGKVHFATNAPRTQLACTVDVRDLTNASVTSDGVVHIVIKVCAIIVKYGTDRFKC